MSRAMSMYMPRVWNDVWSPRDRTTVKIREINLLQGIERLITVYGWPHGPAGVREGVR